MNVSATNYQVGKPISLYVPLGWAVAMVSLNVLARLPAPMVQAAIAGQMLTFVAVMLLAPVVRQYLFTRDLRRLTLFHLWQVIPGDLFLYYY